MTYEFSVEFEWLNELRNFVQPVIRSLAIKMYITNISEHSLAGIKPNLYLKFILCPETGVCVVSKFGFSIRIKVGGGEESRS